MENFEGINRVHFRNLSLVNSFWSERIFGLQRTGDHASFHFFLLLKRKQVINQKEKKKEKLSEWRERDE